MEIWKDIPDYEHYQISNLCRIRNIITGRILRNEIFRGGYLRVTLTKDKTHKHFSIHRLMYITFIGKIPSHLQIGHLDGSKNNNHINNLALVTNKENAEHRKIHGTQVYGEKHINSKLTEENVLYIRKNPDNISMRAMARKFKVSRTAIKYAKISRNWAYLGGK